MLRRLSPTQYQYQEKLRNLSNQELMIELWRCLKSRAKDEVMLDEVKLRLCMPGQVSDGSSGTRRIVVFDELGRMECSIEFATAAEVTTILNGIAEQLRSLSRTSNG